MDLSVRTLVIIPARGGSKGIPRKNLRDLNGKPLIYYSIDTAKGLNNVRIVVDTDDDEIEYIVKLKYPDVFIHRRRFEQGKDIATIDDVIFTNLNDNNFEFEELIVLQPTSPLLSSHTLNKALSDFRKSNNKSAIAVTEFKHLLWKLEFPDTPKLVQKERVNRQHMECLYLETGGFTITKSDLLAQGIRIGQKPMLIAVPSLESLDLDEPNDWSLAEKVLKHSDIYIYVEGNDQIGLGHIYNTLELSHYLASYNIIFITPPNEKITTEIISNFNYPVIHIEKLNLPSFFSNIEGDKRLVVDALDSSNDLMSELDNLGVRIVSFEDRNVNKYKNRIVINALYNGKNELGVYYGVDYFIMRREFLQRRKEQINKIESVLISFGGADPQNFTEQVYRIVREFYNGPITIIMGKANKRILQIDEHTYLMRNISNMAHHMLLSDVAFTSAGRTSLECAALGIPAVVLNQNDRELEHKFACNEIGFIRSKTVGIEDSALRLLIESLLSHGKLNELTKRLQNVNFSLSTQRTIELIKKHLI